MDIPTGLFGTAAIQAFKGLATWIRERTTAQELKALTVLEAEKQLFDYELEQHDLTRRDIDRLLGLGMVEPITKRLLNDPDILVYRLTDHGIHVARMLQESSK